MASPEQKETVSLPTVGEEGDVCAQCGSALAVDQRYCVNCGLRRADNRVDYERQLNGNPAMAGGGAPTTTNAVASGQWTPIWAIGAIAVLGIMLLLGVLIGNDNDDQQVVAGAAAPTTASTPTQATPTDTQAAAPAAAAPKAEAAATAPGAGNVVQGGTGSAEGVAAADTSQQGGGSVQENARSGPDQVATQGEPEKLDPGGQAGGGSSATCIGC
jgi:hypothetical protein